MIKLERILYCEICDESIAYTGVNAEGWESVISWFESEHDHRDPQLRRAD